MSAKKRRVKKSTTKATTKRAPARKRPAKKGRSMGLTELFGLVATDEEFREKLLTRGASALKGLGLSKGDREAALRLTRKDVKGLVRTVGRPVMNIVFVHRD